MNCKEAQLAFSASMDGEDRALTPEARLHVETCPDCSRFASTARRVRAGARVRVAGPVPDLVEPIMSRVREEAERAPVVRMPRASRPGKFNLRSLMAAAVVGALVGVAIVTAGVIPRGAGPALAQDIPHEIASAAFEIDGYQANYRIVERNWQPEVPERRFDVRVAFDSPEMFRVDVDDETKYPPEIGLRNDSKLIVSGERWMLQGPEVCIRAATTECPTEVRSVSETVTGRPPFDADAPMPTDIVLPMTALAGSSRVDVLGEDEVAGRPAVLVELSAGDAAPLFAFFQQAGSWRPLYASDRVLLWLDRESWFPLGFTVTAGGGEDRSAWAAVADLQDRPGDTVLDVRLTSLSLAPPEERRFSVDPGGRSEGFVDLSETELADVVGYEPVEPARLLGLAPYRFGRFAGSDEAVLSYARGLAWVKVRETRTHGGETFFGPVDEFAERVELPGGGIAYYEPAAGQWGRRVAIHARGWDLYMESNLPRAELLDVAASIPIRGEEIPEAWRIRREGDLTVELVSPAEAQRRAGFTVLMPRYLPGAFKLVAAEIVTFEDARGVTMFYSREGSEPAGFGLRIHQAPGEQIPPSSGSATAVLVRGETGRWSPDRQELEWVEDGVYRSVTAPGLDLRNLVAIADSMEAP
ncbi:MAG: hypothetical protein WD276_01445 [Actinomycetota bacterium]